MLYRRHHTAPTPCCLQVASLAAQAGGSQAVSPRPAPPTARPHTPICCPTVTQPPTAPRLISHPLARLEVELHLQQVFQLHLHNRRGSKQRRSRSHAQDESRLHVSVKRS